MNLRKLSLNLAMAAALTLTVASCGPKDAEIKTSVESTIANPGVMVNVEKGVATLSGQVVNEADRAALDAQVKGVKGVKSVVNNVTVAAPVPPPTVAADATLNQSMAAVLKDVPTVKATVVNGVVTLTGTATRDQSVKVLQAVNGSKPKQVINQIVIK